MWFRLVAALVLSCLGPSAWADELHLASVSSSCATVHLFERCELTVSVEGQVINPFDPAEAAVQAVFHPDSGPPVRVEGFYYEPYELVKDGEREQPRRTGTPSWKVRFSPRRVGRWTYDVALTTPQGVQRQDGAPMLVVG